MRRRKKNSGKLTAVACLSTLILLHTGVVEVAGVHRGFPEIRPYLVESTAGNLSPEWAAGGIVTSASDLVRWAQALRDGELLGPEMHREMLTYYPPQEPRGGRSQYMQGIARTEDYYGDYAVLGHGGGTLGFTAECTGSRTLTSWWSC